MKEANALKRQEQKRLAQRPLGNTTQVPLINKRQKVVAPGTMAPQMAPPMIPITPPMIPITAIVTPELESLLSNLVSVCLCPLDC